LAERLLAEAEWPPNSLDRLAVGIGPGTFTGLRVGIALASGMALGLGRPLVGVGSLASMARAAERPEAVAAVLDARRSEWFVAVFDAQGVEIVAPRALPTASAQQTLRDLVGRPFVVVGEPARGWPHYVGAERSDLPHAVGAGLLAQELDPATAPATPIYVRGPGALKPNLPPSPLDS